jgi:uroporphyrinogen decarboxylase
MRQAGRYMPEYQALRQGRSFMEMARSVELCTQITLQPVRAFDLDAAILFADIMTPLEAVGIDFDIVGGEGPVIEEPLTQASQLGRVGSFDAARIGYLFEAIRQIQHELAGQQPLIGFAGAPFTMACYLMEGRGSRDFMQARRALYEAPEFFGELLARLVDLQVAYLREQARAGVDALQVFDSWIGLLDGPSYRRVVLPHMRRLFAELSGLGIPVVHFAPGSAAFLESIAEAGGDVIGVDWRLPLDEAWSRIGADKAVQGNLDPALLLVGGEPLRRGIDEVLRCAAGRPGHIFNLGHGVHRQTPPSHVAEAVQYLRQVGVAGP